MMKKSSLILLTLIHQLLFAQGKTKIIDMHIHCYTDNYFAKPSSDYYGNKGSLSAEAHRKETFAAFKKYNIVKVVASGSPTIVDNWVVQDSNHLIIRGITMEYSNQYDIDTIRFEQMIKDKKTEVFGEIGDYYGGTTLSDSIWQPYLRICAKYDILVAVHTGGGDPGGTYSRSPKARLRLSDPYLIEDVLVNYPKLRIYIMHSGEDWHDMHLD